MVKSFNSGLSFRSFFITCFLLVLTRMYGEGNQVNLSDFSTVGRGVCVVEDNILKSKGAYASYGNNNMRNYRVTFQARANKHAEQVQIWAGFRAFNRADRYVVGLKGGLQNDLYLSRMGYMGADELLGLCDLDFSPEVGQWYSFKIEVSNNRIRIFLNDEKLPRIDVVDQNSHLAPRGQVTLGGGWIETEFKNLKVEPLSEEAFNNLPVYVYSKNVSEKEKEKIRQLERRSYNSIVVDTIKEGRSVINLNGAWLFKPDYESKNKVFSDPSIQDQDWHIMNVPDFWNPIRIWLHGETMNDGKFPKGVSDTYYQKETDRCEKYTFDYKKTKAAWYRQWIELPAGIENKTSELVFDAISKMADVYVNGVLVNSYVGMFGEIRTDVSGLLKPGRNLIAVLVTRDYIKNITDADKIVDVAVTVPVTNRMLKDIAHGFYGANPAGIWQPVSLIITNSVKIEDVYIKPSLNSVAFEVTVKNHHKSRQIFNLNTEIQDCESNRLFYKEQSLSKLKLEPGEEKVFTYSVSGLNPKLWTPQNPNLYNFRFQIAGNKNKEIDAFQVRSGFRTFEVKNGLFELNGIPYWLRGANHTPFALAPNDSLLARKFYKLMKEGNMDVTRTHTSPYNKLWIDIADECGVGISHEGTWPWLMIHSSMPDSVLIKMWADEYIGLLKKYRNHPSILFWTVNNEMKFYDNEPNQIVKRKKMEIISDVVKRMREVDPTRPVSFDSNYRRDVPRLGEEFYKGIDDGDIDDVHSYINWYTHSLFGQFNGEFQRNFKNEGRPLISQEMSTGYPNNETGHATRFYTLVHQNAQSLIGSQAYAFGDPTLFLKTQSFITKELAEALRRTNDKASGILHFALLTWFRNVYDANNIVPYQTYYGMKLAMQPVLVSAELWGRNFYVGDEIATRFCVVNDLESGRSLDKSSIRWQLITEDGNLLSSGEQEVPAVAHYKRAWINQSIPIPAEVSFDKKNVKLKLQLLENNKEVSVNEYELFLSRKEYATNNIKQNKIVLLAQNNIRTVFDSLGITYVEEKNINNAIAAKPKLIVYAAFNHEVSQSDVDLMKKYLNGGGRVLFLNSEEFVKQIFPQHINGYFIPTEGDIVNMEMPESSVFEGIDYLGLRYFNNNKREIPTVCNVVLQINRNDSVKELASHMKIHGYVQGNMHERSDYVKTIKGSTIVKINEGKGEAIISTMLHEKAISDPVAAKLTLNLFNTILQ